MVAAAAMPAAVQRVELAWKLEAGTELVYRQSMQSETGMPQGMGTSSMRSESTQHWTVLEVDGDGNATVRVTTEQAQMSLDGPPGASRVDPADPAGSETVSAAVGGIAGTSYTIVFDPRGAVIGMSGLEEMREALREQVQDPSSQATRWEVTVGGHRPEGGSAGRRAPRRCAQLALSVVIVRGKRRQAREARRG